MRLACPRPAGPLCHVCDVNLVDTRGGNSASRRGPIRMRGPKLRAQAAYQGGATAAYEWERLWHAQQSCPIRHVFRRLYSPIPIASAPAAWAGTSKTEPHTNVHAGTRVLERGGPVWGSYGGLESGVSELPYRKTSTGGMCCWVDHRGHLVRCNNCSPPDGLDSLGSGNTHSKMVQNQGLGRRRRPMSSRLGKMGRQDDRIESAG